MGRGVAKRVTTEERRRAFVVLALHSDNTNAASRALKSQGHPVTARTLRRSREAHPEELEEVRQSVVARVHARVANEQEALVRQATAEAVEYVAEARKQRIEGRVKDAASGARNLQVVAAVGIDKMALLRDRPTAVVQRRHLHEVVTELEQRVPQLKRRFDVESEATELPPAARWLPPPTW